MKPIVKEFFDKATWTLTYVVYDSASKDAVIIDPVWDYDPADSSMSTQSIESVHAFVKDAALKVHYILETHAHADHVSGAQVLKKIFPDAKIAIGVKIIDVQKVFKGVYNLAPDFPVDGRQFDILLNEEEKLHAGSLDIQAIYTPGHTPACSTYVIGDAVFTGDTLFMPDYGTGRCDFPAGSAQELFHSVQKIYQLPEEYRTFAGHDYMPNGRELEFQSTIGQQKKENIHLSEGVTEAEFIEFRNRRDASLAAPRLLLPSVQVNINAGHLPQAENNGVKYLKIPIKE